MDTGTSQWPVPNRPSHPSLSLPHHLPAQAPVLSSPDSSTDPSPFAHSSPINSSSSPSSPTAHRLPPSMIGSSIPPQPAPFPNAADAVQQYMSDIARQDHLSALAFDNIGRRPGAQYANQYPNLHGLDTSNLGGNIHPSALYPSYGYPATSSTAGVGQFGQGMQGQGAQQQAIHHSSQQAIHHSPPAANIFQHPPHQQQQPFAGPSSSYFPPDPAPAFNAFSQQQQSFAAQQPRPRPFPQQPPQPQQQQQHGSADFNTSPPQWGPGEYFADPFASTSQLQPAPLPPLQTSSSSDSSLPSLLPSSYHPLPLPGPRNKRQRTAGGITQAIADVRIEDFEGGEEDEDEEYEPAQGGGRGGKQAGKKMVHACTHCKRLKMRCEREPGQEKCNRCRNRNHECKFEGRKQRKQSNWREILNQKVQEKDATIQYLLKQLNNPWQVTPFHATSSLAGIPPAPLPPPGPGSGSQRSMVEIQEWAADASAQQQQQHTQATLSPNASTHSHSVSMRSRLLSDGEADSDAGDSVLAGGGDALSDAGGRSPAASVAELLPGPDTPFGLLADMGVRAHKGAAVERERERAGSVESPGAGGVASSPIARREGEEEEEEAVGLANKRFFAPGPGTNPGLRRRIIEWQTPPEIMERRIVSPDEVHKLFGIFYERLNPVLAMFDPNIHTPAHVYGRCPFLFTVVCAIASRYYRERPELYQIAMHLARTSAATSLINGWKSVEICQAYIMMSVYSLPAKRWEEDRSWLYLGLAIRMATDLNLHVPVMTKATDEATERELLNRTRTWLICFNLDRSAATQLGRPTSIREDYIIRHSNTFYKRSKYNHPYDIHLCAYTSLLRIMARFLEAVYSDPNAPTGLNKNIDWLSVTWTFEKELQSYQKDTEARFAVDSDKNDAGCRYRVDLLPFLLQYSRLVLWSFGFQQAFEKKADSRALSDFFNNSYEAASEVVRITVEKLAKTDYFSYAPDGHFLFVAFASAFLLKLLRPDFGPLLAEDQQATIIAKITSVVEVFNSVAVDSMHTPRLYARFLQTLLERRQAIAEEAPGSSYSQLDVPDVNVEAPAQEEASAAPAPPHHEQQQQQDTSHLRSETAPRPITPIVMVEGSVTGTLSTVGDETEVPASSTYGGSLFNLENLEEDVDFLASMNALADPRFSDTMMLPGFSWPVDQSMDWLNNYVDPQHEPGVFHDPLDTFVV